MVLVYVVLKRVEIIKRLKVFTIPNLYSSELFNSFVLKPIIYNRTNHDGLTYVADRIAFVLITCFLYISKCDYFTVFLFTVVL